MILVLDASVALKWFFRGREGEDDAHIALQVLDAIGARQVRLIQPPHFLAEIAAVLVRKKPRCAIEDLRDLRNIDMQIANDADLHLSAAEIAIRTRAHVFDTLYHAVALHHPGAVFVTADHRYHRRAAHLGQICLLQSLRLQESP